MKKEEIKKLAKLTMEGKTVNGSVASYVLNKLSRKDLILYLRYLKTLYDRSVVKVLSGRPIPADLKKGLERKFKDKEVVFMQDDKTGDGIKVIMGDTIIDLSTKGYVDEIVENLKN